MPAIVVMILFLLIGCSDQNFSSQTPEYAKNQGTQEEDPALSKKGGKNPNARNNGDDKGKSANDADSRGRDDDRDSLYDQNKFDSSDNDSDHAEETEEEKRERPEITSLGGGERGIAPDYSSCARLPQGGKRGYGKCSSDEAVVIINDGKAQEMTCCPIGRNVLSQDPDDLHVLRQGVCESDEIATGMQSPFAPEIYCSRVNTDFLKVERQGQALYVTRSSNSLSAALNQIAGNYNVNDTCVCPDNQVMLGGHTSRDNQCHDVCGKIIEK